MLKKNQTVSRFRLGGEICAASFYLFYGYVVRSYPRPKYGCGYRPAAIFSAVRAGFLQAGKNPLQEADRLSNRDNKL